MTVVVQIATGDGAKLIAFVPLYQKTFLCREVELSSANGIVSLLKPKPDVNVIPRLVRTLSARNHALKKSREWGAGFRLV